MSGVGGDKLFLSRASTCKSPFQSVVLLKIVTEELPHLLALTLVWVTVDLSIGGLRALGLGHLGQPLAIEGIAVRFAHVVQNAACPYHCGHHVQSAIVALAQALPTCLEPQQRLLGHTTGTSQPSVEQVLALARRRRVGSRSPLLRVGLQ